MIIDILLMLNQIFQNRAGTRISHASRVLFPNIFLQEEQTSQIEVEQDRMLKIEVK